MADETFDLVFRRGAKFERTLTWQDPAGLPISMVGYQAYMQVRRRAADETVLLDLTSDILDPAWSPSAHLRIGPAVGDLTIYLGASVTEAFEWRAGVYDVELHSETDDDDVELLVEGTVSVKGQVTRG